MMYDIMSRPRCKNLGTTGFAKTALQAIQRHIFRRRLFFGRLKNIDLRTYANCKQLAVMLFQKHLVPRFLHRGRAALHLHVSRLSPIGKDAFHLIVRYAGSYPTFCRLGPQSVSATPQNLLGGRLPDSVRFYKSLTVISRAYALLSGLPIPASAVWRCGSGG